jgi:hypothetical protein
VIKLIKILSGIGLALILAYQINENRNLFYQNDFSQFSPALFAVCIVLIPVNWGLEALKWKLLLKPLISLSFFESFKSVLSGVFVGFFTPARIGEYGGRMINLPESLRIPSIASTFFGSIIQNSIHVIAGFAMSYYFIKNVLPEISDDMLVILIGLSLICMCLLIIFSVPGLRSLVFQKFSHFTFLRWLKKFSYIQNISFFAAFQIILISFARYLVYFFQYIFILLSLGCSETFVNLGSGVSFLFMLQSGIPLPPLLSILGRGELSVLVWQQYDITAGIALFATFILWTMNLVIPAIVGYIVILNHKNINHE